MAAAKESLKLAMEGNRVEIECRTNSTLEIDWQLTKTNSNSSLKIFQRQTISDQLKKDHYSLKTFNDSNQTSALFVLSVENVESSDAGLYECKESSSQSQIATIRLTVMRRYTRSSMPLPSTFSYYK